MDPQTPYGFTKVLPDVPFEDAVPRVTDALKEEGFGVLTTIDVKQTLHQKLNQDFRKYVILGACNPPLAHRALSAELAVGLLLPCNVVVFEEGAGSVVQLVKPAAMFEVVGNAALGPIVQEVEERLLRVHARL